MVRFQCIQPGLDETRDPFIMPDEHRVRQRRHAPGLVNTREYLAGGRASSRDKRRSASLKPHIESLVRIGHVAPGDEGPGDPRPAGRLRRFVRGGFQNSVGIETDPARREAVDHLTHPVEAGTALVRQKSLKPGVILIDEITEDMDIGPLRDGGDLNPRNEVDTPVGAGDRRGLAAGRRVVIRHAQNEDTCG